MPGWLCVGRAEGVGLDVGVESGGRGLGGVEEKRPPHAGRACLGGVGSRGGGFACSPFLVGVSGYSGLVAACRTVGSWEASCLRPNPGLNSSSAHWKLCDGCLATCFFVCSRS